MNGIQIFKYFSSFLNVAHSGSKQMAFRKIFADFLTKNFYDRPPLIQK